MKSLLFKCLAVSLAASVTCTVAVRAAGEVKDVKEVKKEEPAAKRGRLQVEKEVVDVGDIVRGEEAKATFTLKNVGEETLKILSAKPG